MLFKYRMHKLDITLFGLMWLTVLVASIKSMGVAPAIVFLVLNLILILRNTLNGMLVLILIPFMPVTALVGLPIGAYVQATILLLCKYVFIDFLGERKIMKANVAFNLMLLFVFYITGNLIIFGFEDRALTYYQKYTEALLVVFLFASIVVDTNKLVIIFKFWAVAAAFSVFIKLAHVYLGDQTPLFSILKNIDVGSDFSLDHRLSLYVDGGYTSRLLWPGEEPNYTSARTIFPFSISLALLLLSRGRNKIFWGGITLLIAIAVVGTYSRSGFITIIIVSVMLLLKGKLKNIISFTTLGVTTAFLVMSLAPTLVTRIFSIDDEVTGDGSGRFYLWRKAFDLWLNSPLFGNGYSSYLQFTGSAAHNTYLEILADTGILGLGLFLSIIFVSLYRKGSEGIRGQYMDEEGNFLTYISLGVLGVSIIINTVSYHDIKLFWIVCIAGYLSNKQIKGKVMQNSAKERY